MNLTRFVNSSLMLAGLLVFGSCSSVDINSAPAISIPAGLPTEYVKMAICLAVDPPKDQALEKITAGERITDNILQTIFKSNREGPWFIEELRENSVVVGYDNQSEYFRVEYQILSGQIVQRIDGSRKLDQKKNTINEDVFEWLGIMESRIRKSMGYVSAMKADFELKTKR